MLTLIFRIVFTALSALLLAALIPVGTFFGWDYAVFCGVGAFAFFLLILLCKQAQERNEQASAEEKEE